MSIKRWLLWTYLLVMILPLVALYALYISINQYYEDKNMHEYFEKWQHVTSIKGQLEHAHMYTQKDIPQAVQALSNEHTMITLYLPTGKILYSSNPIATHTNFEEKQVLYKALYEFQQNYATFVYKEPVYAQGQLVGIYKITVARTEWTEQVGGQTMLLVASVGGFIVLLYGAVLYMLRKRLHEPLAQLIDNMRTFAKGEYVQRRSTKRDEIGALTNSFYDMQQEMMLNREELEREQRQKEFFIASLSHDLKTPLTSIQAYAESMQHNDVTPQQRDDYLRIVQRKADYMKQLLDDLTMFTLLQSPTYTLPLVSVDGEEFFDMLLANYEQVSAEKGFEAATEVHVSGTYRVNPKQLMRVIDNMMANAWAYTHEGGTIRLAAFDQHVPAWCIADAADDGRVHVVVQNSGATLTPAQCEQLFEPLYQLDASRSQIGERGTGLGLSIAKQIIEKHGGTMHAVSTQNEVAIVISLQKEQER